MIEVTLIPKSSYRRSLWKNGLGYTDEIAIFPEGAQLAKGDFLWRLSSARIERASPFSAFPLHDRTLVVLKGNGLRLFHQFEEDGAEDETELLVLHPYEFPGDVPSRCDLVEGPITDLSVFARKAEAEALTDVVTLDEGGVFSWIPAGRWNFACAVEGDFVSEGPEVVGRQSINEGDTLRVELGEPLPQDQALELRPRGDGGKIILVSLQA